jgi:pyridoxamine 5'-phosphate oxidase family protein
MLGRPVVEERVDRLLQDLDEAVDPASALWSQLNQGHAPISVRASAASEQAPFGSAIDQTADVRAVTVESGGQIADSGRPKRGAQELGLLGRELEVAAGARVGADGTPHVVPVGMWSHNAELDTIDVGGREFERTKKFRDAAETGRAAIVIDDIASTDPYLPRAVEVRGRAEAIEGLRPLIRIHPERIVSWGLDSHEIGRRNSRGVDR